jgi:hypothetical protein
VAARELKRQESPCSGGGKKGRGVDAKVLGFDRISPNFSEIRPFR